MGAIFDKIFLKRGPKTRLPHLDDGEVVYLDDKKKFAIGTLDGTDIVDENVADVGDKIFPAFVEPQLANGFYYRDIGPMRHFIFTNFKLYKNDTNYLRSNAKSNLGTFETPIGTTYVTIAGKTFVLFLGIMGTEIIAYSQKDISEANLATGASIIISESFCVPI